MKALAVALLLLASVAHAEDKPWAVGVPAEQQRDALVLYQKGNGFFEQAQYKQAYEHYQKAIALWDHPGIRYNAAVCLINMDRPVEAYENLAAALRFGEPPLGADLYKQGLSYKKLLDNQVGELQVKSDDSGAKISLDGVPLFDAPGEATRHVTIKDPHQVVAEKPGFETETRPVPRITPGVRLVVAIKLRRLAGGRNLERRWARWLPWAVVIGGAAVAVAGVPLYVDASRKLDDYDSAVKAECKLGCMAADYEALQRTNADLRLKSRANTEAVLSYSAFAIGGAVFAAGLALVVLNQPRLTVVTPSVSHEHVGLVVSADW